MDGPNGSPLEPTSTEDTVFVAPAEPLPDSPPTAINLVVVEEADIKDVEFSYRGEPDTDFVAKMGELYQYAEWYKTLLVAALKDLPANRHIHEVNKVTIEVHKVDSKYEKEYLLAGMTEFAVTREAAKLLRMEVEKIVEQPENLHKVTKGLYDKIVSNVADPTETNRFRVLALIDKLIVKANESSSTDNEASTEEEQTA